MTQMTFGIDLPDASARYNVAPMQIMPIVRAGNPPAGAYLKWGNLTRFDPAKPPTLLINARAETASTKTTFKKALIERRCVALADGFYEWQRRSPTDKTPFMMQLSKGGPFFMAGLRWDATEDQPERYVVLTTAPNELMAPIHDRMPVILQGANARRWIDPRPIAQDEYQALVASFPPSQMRVQQVSSLVNNARNDMPEVIVPVG